MKRYFEIKTTNCLFALFIACLFLLSWTKNASFDFYFYLAVVEQFFIENKLPEYDPFLFSINQDQWVILHEWASMAAYSIGHFLGGELGVQLLKLSIIFSIATILLKRSIKSRPFSYTLIAFTLFLIQFRLTLRGSLFGYFFFLFAIIIFHDLKKHQNLKKTHLLFSGLVCLWVNFHPSFVIAYLAPLLLVRRLKDITKVFPFYITAFIASLVNPKHFYAYEYPFRSFFDEGWAIYKQNNLEWFSLLNTHILKNHEPYFYLVLVILCAILLLKTKASLGKWLIFGLTFYLSLDAARLIPYSAIFCSYLLLTNDKLFLDGKKTIILAYIVLTTLIVKPTFVGHQNLSGRVELGHGKRSATFPDRAIKILNGLPSDKLKLFNQHKFGSYLAYRWKGKPKVYFHGFVNDFKFYKEDYISVNKSLKEFHRVNQKHMINAYLLSHYSASKKHGPLLYQFLHRSKEWRMIFKDKQSILFVHQSILKNDI